MSDEMRGLMNKIRTCEGKLLRSKDPWKIEELRQELSRLRFKMQRMRWNESPV